MLIELFDFNSIDQILNELSGVYLALIINGLNNSDDTDEKLKMDLLKLTF